MHIWHLSLTSGFLKLCYSYRSSNYYSRSVNYILKPLFFFWTTNFKQYIFVRLENQRSYTLCHSFSLLLVSYPIDFIEEMYISSHTHILHKYIYISKMYVCIYINIYIWNPRMNHLYVRESHSRILSSVHRLIIKLKHEHYTIYYDYINFIHCITEPRILWLDPERRKCNVISLNLCYLKENILSTEINGFFLLLLSSWLHIWIMTFL